MARPAENVSQLISAIRNHVREQLVRSSNYACVETIERKYLLAHARGGGSCDIAVLSDASEIVSDRLRLDLAVSQGREIFSWHGASKFSSSRISDLVGSGVVSSGNFVGFLRNIFIPAGVRFTLEGASRGRGREIFRFEYSVAQEISRYRIGVANQSAIVPFHGSFSAYSDTLELAELTVRADHIPPAVQLCAAETGVHFQMANISGRETLIPSHFELKTVSDRSLYTMSRGTYADCHEFKTESKLRFDTPDSETSGVASTVSQAAQTLPAGLELHVSLTTPLDTRTAFTGDPVEAKLTDPVSSLAEKISIPSGAILHGAITQLELHSEKSDYWYLRIEFDHLDTAKNSYLLKAVHVPTGKEEKILSSLYGSDELPRIVAEGIRAGTMVFRGYHLRLDKRFHGEWHTLSRSPDNSGEQAAASR